MADAEQQTPTRLQVRPLNPALGAEVRGVDMRKPIDPATFAQLHDAWMGHLVVVLPEQHKVYEALPEKLKQQVEATIVGDSPVLAA